MDQIAEYCATRRELEEQTWVLVSKHLAATEAVNKLAGHKDPTFGNALHSCQSLRQEAEHSRDELAEHRSRHGC
jgi:hypothetical protein